MKNRTYIIIAVLTLLLFVGAAFAVNTLTSNTVTVNPQPTPTPTPSPTLVLASNTTTPYIGDAIKLTATLSTHQPGIAVTFYMGSANIGIAATDGNGNAVLETDPLAAGTKTFYASCTIG